ncbi:hypothetical protein STEG23_014741 [Scotinomys teguina]
MTRPTLLQFPDVRFLSDNQDQLVSPIILVSCMEHNKPPQLNLKFCLNGRIISGIRVNEEGSDPWKEARISGMKLGALDNSLEDKPDVRAISFSPIPATFWHPLVLQKPAIFQWCFLPFFPREPSTLECFQYTCCGIILLYTVKIYRCDWFNKEADWPTAEQNKFGWESQTENKGKKKGRIGQMPEDAEKAEYVENEEHKSNQKTNPTCVPAVHYSVPTFGPSFYCSEYQDKPTITNYPKDTRFGVNNGLHKQWSPKAMSSSDIVTASDCEENILDLYNNPEPVKPFLFYHTKTGTTSTFESVAFPGRFIASSKNGQPIFLTSELGKRYNINFTLVLGA